MAGLGGTGGAAGQGILPGDMPGVDSGLGGIAPMMGATGDMFGVLGDKLKGFFGSLGDANKVDDMSHKLAMTMDPSVLETAPTNMKDALANQQPLPAKADEKWNNVLNPVSQPQPEATAVPPTQPKPALATPLTLQQQQVLMAEKEKRDEMLRQQMMQRAPAVAPQQGKGVGTMQQLSVPTAQVPGRRSFASILGGR